MTTTSATNTDASRSGTRSGGSTLRIEPTRGWVPLKLREVWEYHELLYFFVWRDIKVRYKQTLLGAAWAIIQPFLTMVVFSVIFGKLARMPSDGIPYPIFSYAALVPWSLFSSGMGGSANSVVASAGLIKKIYFPRLIIPIAHVLTPMVDFLMAFLMLLVLMVYFGIVPTIHVLWLPFFLLLTLLTGLGVGLWLAAVNVQFRDVRHLVPYVIQIWMFATPIVYPSSLIPEQWRPIYGLNPMVGVVEGFRWALLGSQTQPGPVLLASSLAALAILVSGAFYFRRMERTFADVA